MGRRSVNTTKSGKFMNPTDQARKIARRRELKKNKKQRNEVRMAVLKSKDPRHLIDEMEQIDLMEFNPRQAPQLNERVLKEKRRKLKETFERVYQMYEREDPELAVELKKAEVEYEKIRAKRALYYEQVKNAERVNIDMIPLPEAPGSQATASNIPPPMDIPMPSSKSVHGILKRSIGPQMVPMNKLTPPGHPPGPPPSLSDDDDDVDDGETRGADNDDEKPRTTKGDKKAAVSQQTPATGKKRKIRFEDDGDGDDDDEEEEKDSRSKFKSPAAFNKSKENKKAVEEEEDDDDDDDDDGGIVEGSDSIPARLPPSIPPPSLYRLPPPMLPPGMLPPGPPPRMRPPPGLPPLSLRQPGNIAPPPGSPPRKQAGILSAPPTYNKASSTPFEVSAPVTAPSFSQASSATISAKPKIRSLIGDATRFMPLSVKVRREVRDARGNLVKPSPVVAHTEPKEAKKDVGEQAQKASTDDAYDSFMKEMQGFL